MSRKSPLAVFFQGENVVWRRKKDGTHVVVLKFDEEFEDVAWASVFGRPRRRGNCYADTFLNTYERVS